jgi:flagellin-like protein
MKANQAFKANDEAVSPVIGVILMVAITVVLAAVVFVLVSNLSKGGSQSAPTLAIATDDTLDRLTMTSAATGADWSRLSISTVSCSGTGTPIINIGAAAAPHQNAAATAAAKTAISVAGTATTCGAGTAVQIATTPTAIKASDYLSFCITGTAPTATTVIVSITDTVANSQVGQYTFTNIAVCA